MTDFVDLTSFADQPGVLSGQRLALVIKSQDQFERRTRMLASFRSGSVGRIKIAPRPVATGLVVLGSLDGGAFRPEVIREFREPRHLYPLPDGGWLLTEISRLLRLDAGLNIVAEHRHPYYSYLHTVACNRANDAVVVASCGYDCVIGLDMSDDGFRERFRWMAWDHGFNPDGDNCWLTDDAATLERYRAEGKDAALINPADYGERGLLTERRSVHPNHACWDPYDDDRSFLVICACDGRVSRVRPETLETTTCLDVGSPMPHGLKPWQGGWCVTATLRGRWLHLDRDFKLRREISAAGLSGKPAELGDAEWLQQVVPLGERYAVLLDANRGLMTIDLEERRLSRYDVDPNWCVQDAHFLAAP